MSRIQIVIGLVISLFVVPLVVLSILTVTSQSSSAQLTNTPPERTSSDLSAAIARSNRNLRDQSGKPTFSLINSKRLANNWYVAWIDTKTIKVLINDPSVGAQYMSVILGPASTFNQSDARSRGVPDSIYEAFTNATT